MQLPPGSQTSVLFTLHLFTLCLKSLTMAITIASLTTRLQKLKKKKNRRLLRELSEAVEQRSLGFG